MITFILKYSITFCSIVKVDFETILTLNLNKHFHQLFKIQILGV